MKKNRILSLLCAGATLIMSSFMFFPKQETVHAEDEEYNGYWKLVEVTDIADMPSNGEYFYDDWSISDDATSEWKYHEHHLQKKAIPGSNYDPSGETMNHYVRLSPLADTYRVGDTIELNVEYHFETNIPLKTMGAYTGALGGVHEMECVPDAWQTVQVWLDQDTRIDYGLKIATGGLGAGSKPPTIFQSETTKIEVPVGDTIETSERNIDSSAVIKQTVVEPSYSTDLLAIGCNMRVNGDDCSTVYLYQWIDESEKIISEPDYKDRGYWQLNSIKNYGGGVAEDTTDNALTTVVKNDEGVYYHNHVKNGDEWLSHIIFADLLDKRSYFYAGETVRAMANYRFETNLTKEMGKDLRDEIIGLEVAGYYQEHEDNLESVAKINQTAGDVKFGDDDGNTRFMSDHNSDSIYSHSDWCNTSINCRALFAEMPEGRKNGEKLYIDYHFTTAKAPDAYTVFEYEWHDFFAQGDVSGDGELTVIDVILLQKWLHAVPNTRLTNWKAADLTQDNIINIYDLILLKKLILNQ